MIESYKSLQRICRQNKKIKKILLMPSYSSGQQFVQAAALEGLTFLNLKVETLYRIAYKFLESYLYQRGLTAAKNTTLQLLLFEILEGLDNEGRLKYFNRLELTPGVNASIYRAVQELRMAGITAARLDSESFITPEKGEDLFKILREYEEQLRRNKYLDEAELYRIALKEIKPREPEAVFILPPVLRFRRLEGQFLKKLNPEIRYLSFEPVRGIQPPKSFLNHLNIAAFKPGNRSIDQEDQRKSDTYPYPEEKSDPEKDMHTDHSRFSYLYQIEEMPPGLEEPVIRIRAAYGERNEVVGVIRDLKKRKTPFDLVNILYTSREPYVQLFYNLACKLKLPVTYGEGINIRNTNPGKLYFALLNWVSNKYNALELSRIITGGIFSTAEDTGISPVRIAAVIREARIGWSRERYLPALEREMERYQRRIEQIETAGGELKYYQQRLGDINMVREFIRELFSIIPAVDAKNEGLIDYAGFARGMSKLLASNAEIKSELDIEAREVILAGLKPVTERGERMMPPEEALNRLSYLLEGRRVGSSSPRPGHLHLTVYQQGLWQQREETFILGLNSNRFPGRPYEDPILLDSEREALAGIALSRNHTRDNAYLFYLLLASLRGSVNLSFPAFNTTENREESPSAVLLQIYRLFTGDPDKDYSDLKQYLKNPVEFIPRDDSGLLDEADFWLLKSFRERGFENHDSLMSKIYPDHWRGILAHHRRYSKEFSRYNGNIVVDPASVDPRKNGMKLSASKLEQLATCPYSYFLRHILQITPPDDILYDPGVWLDPPARGSLLHRIYELFYREITEKGERPQKSRHQGLIEKIASSELLRQREELPPPGEAVYRYEAEEILHSCRIFLASEEDNRNEARPCYFELAFGTGRSVSKKPGPLEPVELELPSGGKICLGGIIDRVDRDLAGRYHIIDYKTGSTKKYNNRDYFRQGRQLQHALYALALEKILEVAGEKGVRVEKAEYLFPTLQGEGRRYSRIREGRERVLEIIELLMDTVEEGDFIPAFCDKDYNNCWYCDFQLICERERDDILTELRTGSDHSGIVRLRGLEDYA